MSGGGNAPTNNGASGAAGVEDDLSGLKGAAGGNRNNSARKRQIADLFKGILGGGGDGNGKTGLAGLAGGGGKKNNFKAETLVADTAGDGATSGLPTADDNGEISMVFRQVSSHFDSFTYQ